MNVPHSSSHGGLFVVLVFLAVSGCDHFNTSMAGYFLDNTGVVEVTGIIETGNTVLMTNGTILIRPGQAAIGLILSNPRNFTVRQTLAGAPDEKNITVEQIGSGESVVRIPAALLDDDYSLTLAMQSPDGLRDFAPYTMRVRCVSFETALLDFRVNGVPLSLDPGDGYAFLANVSYDTETVTLAGTTIVPDATIEIYQGDASGTRLAGAAHTVEAVSSLVPGDNRFCVRVTNLVESRDYTVTVYRGANPDKAIKTFTILSPVSAEGIINEEDHSVSVTVPYGTNLGAMTAAVTHTGVSITPDPGTEQNYAGPVTYTVTAADGTAQSYTVVVTEGPGLVITAVIDTFPVLTFSDWPVSAAAGDTITIAIDGAAGSWYVELSGPETLSFTTNPFTLPTTLAAGFYNVSVIAVVGGIDYSGSFTLTIE
jgi:hypothetical protein